MASIKIKGDTSGSTTITAPATGSDETIELSTALAAKAPSASPTFTGTVALPSTTTLDGSTLNPSGLVLITSESFSAVSSVSVNNAFSATYENYLLVLTMPTSSVDGDVQVRWRVGGSDNSTASSYVTQEIRANNTTVAASRTTSNLAKIGSADNAIRNAIVLNILNPFEAVETTFISQNHYGASGAYAFYITGSHNQTTSYDGFTLSHSTGTMSGTLKVYGYKD